MSFNILFNRLSPRLKRVAKVYRKRGLHIEEDDLYQEMSIYLWENYKNGVPTHINDAYIIRGCEFHILNYIRKKRGKVFTLSLDDSIDDLGNTLKEIIPDNRESLVRELERRLLYKRLSNVDLTKKEEEVLSLLKRGHTVREAAKKLDISHVMVVKHKKNIIKKYQKNRLP